MASLRDVARLANVSLATASRALNSDSRVNPSTRLLVWKASQKLGYSISKLRNLSCIQKSVLILIRGLQGSEHTTSSSGLSDFPRHVTCGVQSIMETCQITTHIERTSFSANKAEFQIEPGLVGILIASGIKNPKFIENLKELGLPFVVVGSYIVPHVGDSVMADVNHGTQILVKHLVEQGCRKIGFINGPPDSPTSEEKYNGMRLFLALNDLPFDPSLIISGEFDAESGFSSTKKLLASHPDIDGLLYGDDRQAIGGMKEIKEQGRRIPEDMAVASFGNYEYSKRLIPSLTSVSYDMNAMGRIAAQRLLMLVEQPYDIPWQITVPTELIVRESSRRMIDLKIT